MNQYISDTNTQDLTDAQVQELIDELTQEIETDDSGDSLEDLFLQFDSFVADRPYLTE